MGCDGWPAGLRNKENSTINVCTLSRLVSTVLTGFVFMCSVTPALADEEPLLEPSEPAVEETKKTTQSQTAASVASEVSTRFDVQRLSRAQERDLFRELSPEAAFALWSDKIENVISQGHWSDEQLGLLIELQGVFEPELFTRSANGENNESWKRMDAWLDRAGELFSTEELARSFATLKDYSDAMSFGKGAEEEGRDFDCGCHIGGVGLCQIFYVCMDDVYCIYYPSGCGLFGQRPCDGACFRAGPT